jgi:hypothetical protein
MHKRSHQIIKFVQNTANDLNEQLAFLILQVGESG